MPVSYGSPVEQLGGRAVEGAIGLALAVAGAVGGVVQTVGELVADAVGNLVIPAISRAVDQIPSVISGLRDGLLSAADAVGDILNPPRRVTPLGPPQTLTFTDGQGTPRSLSGQLRWVNDPTVYFVRQTRTLLLDSGGLRFSFWYSVGLGDRLLTYELDPRVPRVAVTFGSHDARLYRIPHRPTLITDLMAIVFGRQNRSLRRYRIFRFRSPEFNAMRRDDPDLYYSLYYRYSFGKIIHRGRGFLIEEKVGGQWIPRYRADQEPANFRVHPGVPTPLLPADLTAAPAPPQTEPDTVPDTVPFPLPTTVPDAVPNIVPFRRPNRRPDPQTPVPLPDQPDSDPETDPAEPADPGIQPQEPTEPEPPVDPDALPPARPQPSPEVPVPTRHYPREPEQIPIPDIPGLPSQPGTDPGPDPRPGPRPGDPNLDPDPQEPESPIDPEVDPVPTPGQTPEPVPGVVPAAPIPAPTEPDIKRFPYTEPVPPPADPDLDPGTIPQEPGFPHPDIVPFPTPLEPGGPGQPAPTFPGIVPAPRPDENGDDEDDEEETRRGTPFEIPKPIPIPTSVPPPGEDDDDDNDRETGDDGNDDDEPDLQPGPNPRPIPIPIDVPPPVDIDVPTIIRIPPPPTPPPPELHVPTPTTPDIVADNCPVPPECFDPLIDRILERMQEQPTVRLPPVLPGTWTYDSCDEDAEAEQFYTLPNPLNSLQTLSNQIKSLGNMVLAIAEDRLPCDSDPPVVAIPDHWEHKLSYPTAQLVITWKTVDPPYSYWRTSVPHPKADLTEERLREILPEQFSRGSEFARIVLTDNSKIIVNCISRDEAILVGDALVSLVADIAVEGHIKTYGTTRLDLERRAVKPVFADYYPNGQRDVLPQERWHL